MENIAFVGPDGKIIDLKPSQLATPYAPGLVQLGQQVRLSLARDVDFYVSPDGNDDNDGLTPDTAWADLGKALDYLHYRIDPGPYTATIHLAAGTYDIGQRILAGGLTYPTWQKILNTDYSSSVILAGAGSANTTIKGMLHFVRASMLIKDLTVDCSALQGTMTTPCCIKSLYSDVWVQNVNFVLANSGVGVLAQVGSQFLLSGSCSIAGGNGAIDIFLFLYNSRGGIGGGGTIAYSGQVVTRSNIYCGYSSSIDMGAAVFSGSVTGRRYVVGVNSFIGTGGGGGGYYGGYSGSINAANGTSGGSGGSSYASGHTGCVAITSVDDQNPKTDCTTGTSDNSCSVHYSRKVFTNTVMIDGAGYAWTNIESALTPMPDPAGGNYASGAGHRGNGVARITLL
jgi:hypothetical protein